MARLVLLIQGFFLILGSFMVLWWVSPGGQSFQRQAGIETAGLGPRDVALVAAGLFAVGFMCLSGYTLQRFTAALTGAVVGGSAVRGEASARPMLAWGLLAYLAVAGLFGTFVLLIVDGSSDFARFGDPAFLRLVLTWPYHLMAAVGLFGLPAEAFYQ